MGLVMSGSNLGFMLGPSIGGWLYETGGARLPFLAVTVLALVGLAGFVWLRLPPPTAAREPVPLGSLIRVPQVASCVVAVVAASSTFSMFEPVFSLFLATSLGLSPGRVGLVFGGAAVASAVLHPLYGRLADRYGARRVMIVGMAASAAVMPLLAQAETFRGAVALFLLQAVTLSMVVTPSLAYMAEASARAGAASFGVSYGLYNFAWGCGLLGGPAVGGVLYGALGFTRMLMVWAVFVFVAAVWLARAPGGTHGGRSREGREGQEGQEGGKTAEPAATRERGQGNPSEGVGVSSRRGWGPVSSVVMFAPCAPSALPLR
jgi:predicted MFS family arabinose efflux permease